MKEYIEFFLLLPELFFYSIFEESMTCFMCKGSVRDGVSTFTADIGGCIVVIKNVPSRVCGQCGESSYDDETARRLEQIVQNIMGSASAEIAVVSYSEKAA
jgi:YgiT-type zinc finger domain-containing protein